MNKKLLTAFLFGATVLASTSTFVSCKDYDDEIGDLQTQINDANALHATKAELAAAKAELQKQLEEVKGELATAVAKLEAADEKLNGDIKALKEASEKADAELAEAIKKAEKDANAYTDAEIKKLSDKADAAHKALEDKIAQTKADLQKEMAEKDAALEAALKAYADAGDKKNADAIEALKKENDEAHKKFEEMDKALDDAIKANGKAIEDEVVRATAAETALEGRIEKVEKAVKDLDALTKKLAEEKLDKATYEAELIKIYAAIKACGDNCAEALKKEIADRAKADSDIETAYKAADAQLAKDFAKADEILEGKLNTKIDGKADTATVSAVKAALGALKTDYETQKAVCQSYETKVDGILADYLTSADKKALNQRIDSVIIVLNNEIDKLSTFQSAVKDSLANHWDYMTTVDASVKAINSYLENDLPVELDAREIRVSKSLRSLVFCPTSYYWGVEATEINYLEYKAYTPEAADATKADNSKATLVHNADEYASYKAGSKVLSFAANYYMNPSNANLEGAEYSLVSADRDYVRSATKADAILSIVGVPTAANGILTVNLNAQKPQLIKSAAENSAQPAVTVFATQVTLPNEKTGEQVITSDFATVYCSKIKDPVIAFNPVFTNNVDDCKVYKTNSGQTTKKGQHLFSTAAAAAAAEPLAKIYYKDNEGFDIAAILETHYQDENNSHMLMSANRFETAGFAYKYELVGYLAEDGKTVISSEKAQLDGSKIKANAVADVTTVGTYPMVRVSLVDAKNDATVYDYGYIMFKIILKDNVEVGHEGPGIDYKGDCAPAAYTVNIAANEFKAALDTLNITYKEFQTLYKMNAVTAPEGTTISSDKDNIVIWTLSPAYLVKNLYSEKFDNTTHDPFTQVVTFSAIDKDSDFPDVKLTLSTGAITIQYSNGKAFSYSNKDMNENYWYTTNTNKAGFNEIHVQARTSEDTADPQVGDIKQTISKVFVGGKVSLFEVNDVTVGKDFTNPTLDFNFYIKRDAEGNSLEKYKGYEGLNVVEYTLDTKAGDPKTLVVIAKDGKAVATPVAVANISTGEINGQVIKYENTDEAKALLNYKSHNQLANDVIKATLILSAQTTKCDHMLNLSDNTFDVRFLRPINVFLQDAIDIEDAQDELQVVDLKKFLKYTDWRDYKFEEHENYYEYYGVEPVTIFGYGRGTEGNVNGLMKTNMNGANFGKTLAEVADDAVEFTFNEAQSLLYYRNNGTTVRDFSVKIPLVVRYIWGEIVLEATVNVKSTHNNANKR